jgi:hypothetical protein
MRFLILLYSLAFISIASYSQQTKKVYKKSKNRLIVEEFYVLKDDKTIKNGTYLKYIKPFLIESFLQEFGNYDHNGKTGVWFFFRSFHPQNPLSIIGEFKDGQRTGKWAYFYPPDFKSNDGLYLLGLKKANDFFSDRNGLHVTLDTTGLKLAVTGNFENNYKIGRWNYYSKEGELIRIYDFSTKNEVYSVIKDSINFFLYGGMSQFKERLTQSFYDNIDEINRLPKSDTSFEIITNDGNLYINNLTPLIYNPLGSYIEKALNNMSMDWIDFDPYFENISFILNINFTKKDGGSELNLESINPKLNNNN